MAHNPFWSEVAHSLCCTDQDITDPNLAEIINRKKRTRITAPAPVKSVHPVRRKWENKR